MTAQYGLLIDYELCTGCHTCEVACKEEHRYGKDRWGIRVFDDGPWQKEDGAFPGDDQGKHFNWNKIPVPTDLCDGCADRVAEGRKPTCMHHCLAEVITYGTIEELAVELAKKPKQVLWAIK